MGSRYYSRRVSKKSSTTALDTNKSCLMNQEELTDLVSKLQQKTKGGKQIMVINLQTNTEIIYPCTSS